MHMMPSIKRSKKTIRRDTLHEHKRYTRMNGTLRGDLLTLYCKDSPLEKIKEDLLTTLGNARDYIANLPVHTWTGRPTLTIRLDSISEEDKTSLSSGLKHIASCTSLCLRQEKPEPSESMILLAYL